MATSPMSGMRLARIVLWALVVVAAIGATALFVFRPPAPPAIGGGQYALVDQHGAPATQAVLTGKPSMLFFGYTHCPDVCPTTMGEMQGWFSALGAEAKDLQGVFITVDPERDTPEILNDYVSWVSDKLVALTGPQAEIDKATKAWGALAEKVPAEDGNYLMNHTASVFLVDRRGQFFGTIAYGEATDTALAKIRRLVAAS